MIKYFIGPMTKNVVDAELNTEKAILYKLGSYHLEDKSLIMEDMLMVGIPKVLPNMPAIFIS